VVDPRGIMNPGVLITSEASAPDGDDRR
jgi:hypothetical protein